MRRVFRKCDSIRGMEHLSENRRGRFDYEISETVEAGIELLGHEVKSARAGHMNIAGSYAIIRGGETWLVNANIPPYQPKNTAESYDPKRTRRLLLKKEEIRRLLGQLKEKKFSLIALAAYSKNNRVKIELGLGRLRKKHDKRDLLKKRAIEEEMRRGGEE